MSFVTPWALLSLLALPVIALAYWRSPRRRAVLTATRGASSNPRRHWPFALVLTAIALLLTGFARPEMNLNLPRYAGTIMVVVDTSNSMVADDVAPSRIEQAKATAIELIEQRPPSIDVGLVAFTEGAAVVAQPTTETGDVVAAVQRLGTEGGTSIGQGLFAALDAITPDPIEIDSEANSMADLDIGFHSNAVIVLISDGEDLGGVDARDVAALASNAGVRVHTVGVGTDRGTVVQLDGFSIATALDAAALDTLADITGGTHRMAGDDIALDAVFDDVDRRFEQRGEQVEITGLLAGAAMVLLIGAIVISMRWFGRVL